VRSAALPLRASPARRLPPDSLFEVEGQLQLALEGRFNDHHALMLRLHLDHVDHLSAMVDRLDEEVDRAGGPFLEPMRRLQTIPGVGKRTDVELAPGHVHRGSHRA
jgi:transposase